MPTYDFTVSRDGHWHMIHIPAIDGLTQARDAREIDLMAREYIAVSTDTPADQVHIRRI